MCNAETHETEYICHKTGFYFNEPERYWAINCIHCGNTFCEQHIHEGGCYYDDNIGTCEQCAKNTCPKHRLTVTALGEWAYYEDGHDHSKCVMCSNIK